MNSEKFTPGKWEVSLHELHDDIFDNLEYRIWKCGENKLIAQFETWDTTRFAESKANAALISAAPEMYSNEEKNLEILKIIQDVYTELKYLIEHDSDAKTCLPSLPEDTFDFILKKIKIRIINTENALKKARGEE